MDVASEAQRWENKDIERLISLWGQYGSVMLIAAIMGRSPASIQTQASRRQLPHRHIKSGPRRAWTNADDDYIASAVEVIVDGEKVDVLEAAKTLDRSLDAIIPRMASSAGMELRDFLHHLAIPDPDDVAESGISGAPEVPSKPKPCPMCLRPFVSKNPKKWFVCDQCKSSDSWRNPL